MRDYLQVLIWMMLFIVIVEMLFPETDIKKYLNLVLGFIVIYTVISPITNLITSSEHFSFTKLSDYVNYYQLETGQAVYYGDYEEERLKQQEEMENIHQRQVEQVAAQLIEKDLDIKVENIESVVVFNEDRFEVEELIVEVSMKEETSSFGIGIESKEVLSIPEDEKIEKEIIKCLNDFYNWDNTNIYIEVQKN